MFIIKKSASTIFLFFLFNLTYAQLPWFTNMPLYYNSSYAGSGEKLTVAFSSRINRTSNNFDSGNNLLSPSSPNYNKHAYGLLNDISIDKFIPKLKSGIGFSMSFNKGVNYYFGEKETSRIFEPGVYFAPKFSFSGKHTFSPSISIKYLDNKFNSNPGLYSNYDKTWKILKFNLGLLYNTNKLQLGINTKVLERELVEGKNYLFPIITIHGGYNFSKSEDSKFSFTPIFYLNFHGLFDSKIRRRDFRPVTLPNNEDFSNIYLNFRYKKFITGTDFNLNLMAGYQNKNMRVLITSNALANIIFEYYLQATQLSFRYNFK